MAISFLAAAGKLTAINKVSHADQLQRISRGDNPAVRPVNSGLNFTKGCTKGILDTKAGVANRVRLSRYNVGVGTPCGPEVIAHKFRSEVTAGNIPVTKDVSNAFCTFSRQAMFDQFQSSFPAAYQYFVGLYEVISPISYIYTDVDGKSRVRISFSAEGARQGCTAGSTCFGMVVHPVYEQLHKEFFASNDNGDSALAIVDDYVASFDASHVTPENPEAMIPIFDKILHWHVRYDQICNPLGLFCNKDKGKFFLRPGLPDPPPRPSTEPRHQSCP